MNNEHQQALEDWKQKHKELGQQAASDHMEKTQLELRYKDIKEKSKKQDEQLVLMQATYNDTGPEVVRD